MTGIADLAAAVQVGIQRATPPPTGVLDDYPRDDPAKSVLIEAGALDLMRRAGAQGRAGIQPLAEAPPETRQIAFGSAVPLAEALESKATFAVLAWAKRARDLDRIAPPTTLLKLIELSEQHKPIRHVLGRRGLWLAGLMGVEIGEIENEGGDTIRERLTSEGEALDWKERLRYVEALERDLRVADEEILTTALSDRRKEVREAAARLLAQLDRSAWVRELQRVGQGRLQVVRKLLSKALLVNPPDPAEIPKTVPRTTSREKLGPKALALYDLVRWTKPSYWAEQTGLSVDDLLAMAAKSEYSDALIAGWFEAAQEVHGDQKWIDALFSLGPAQPSIDWTRLAGRASQSVFENYMRTRSVSGQDAYRAFSARQGPYSPEFSRYAIERMEKEGTLGIGIPGEWLDSSVLPLLSRPWDNEFDSLRKRLWTSVDLRKRLLDSLSR